MILFPLKGEIHYISVSGGKRPWWGRGGGEDVMSFPMQEAHHNLCKTAPLDKHNVAIYTPGHFLLLLQLVKA